MAKDKPKVNKPKVGRPSVMTDEVLDKLRQAFLIGATKEEACAFANIGYRTLYDYLDKKPEFSQEIEKWQKEPILKAKATIVKNLDDSKNAQWYLERRAKEFKPKQDLTTNDKELPTPLLQGIAGVINVQPHNSSQEVIDTPEQN
jgi:hypothetical protein